ncbi:MAG: radical SAM protein [Desulfomonile sp.]|nr:radical SAM protein [Desulfomonile sp.]
MLKSSEISYRAQKAHYISSSCALCPRRCRVNRTAGERGYCGAGPEPAIAAAVAHFGEEPPLTGEGGAGTIFFTRCNLRCVYCQNHEISQGGVGRVISPEALALEMLRLQRSGCATIEPVSPSHHLPGLLAALAQATERGLTLPVVYNTNGYEAPETLDLLDGIIDVYLPDLKYASDQAATKYSDACDYVKTARSAILKMYDQVGNLVVGLSGTAVRGMILRHLILPGDLAGTRETLLWIRDHLPTTVTLSLMAQYSPLHRSAEFIELHRKLSEDEYERAVDLAWDLGFENVFVQDLSSQKTGIPDFGADVPFRW